MVDINIFNHLRMFDHNTVITNLYKYGRLSKTDHQGQNLLVRNLWANKVLGNLYVCITKFCIQLCTIPSIAIIAICPNLPRAKLMFYKFSPQNLCAFVGVGNAL